MQLRTFAQALAVVASAFIFSYFCGNGAKAAPVPARVAGASSTPIEARVDLRIHCKGEINSIAFSPNGRTLAAAVEPRQAQPVTSTEVVLYDTRSGHVQQKFVVPGAVFDLEFSPDGKTLLLNLLQWKDNVAENSLQLWEVATRRLRKIASTSDEPLFAPNGKVLVTAGDRIRIFSSSSWKPVRSFPVAFKGEPIGAEFSPDSRLVAMLHASFEGEDIELHIVDISTGKVVASLRGNERGQDVLAPPFAFVDPAPFVRRDRSTAMIFAGNLIHFQWKNGKWMVSESKSLLSNKERIVEAVTVGKRNLAIINDLNGRRVLWDCDKRRTLRTWNDKARLTQNAAFSRDQNRVVLVDGRDLLITSLTPRP